MSFPVPQRFRPALLSALLIVFLACATATVAVQPGQVRIVRDHYGVPHIYADDVYALFYGYGYAVGQDRLFQMEMMKRTTSGRVAEVLGERYLELDRTVRRGFSPALLRRQMDALQDDDLAVFQGYADGLNAWIAEVEKQPRKFMPREYLDFDFRPSTWDAYDVMLLIVGSMAHRYADFNEEINNLVFYQRLLRRHDPDTAWRIFNAALPLYDPKSPTTVPDEEARARRPSYTGRVRPDYLRHLPSPPQVGAVFEAGGGNDGKRGFPSASNIWLAGKSKLTDADGVLVNGPQFGWINPSYVYGVGLHGAGFEVVGNTLLAYPFMLFSHNGRIAWGSTAGFGDLVDVYVSELHPENPGEYFHDGEYKPLQERVEEIHVKGGAAAREVFYRTVYGPVVLHDAENGVVYSKKRAWEGGEVETALAWVALAKARDYAAWRRALARMSTNINFYFLDAAGNIAYTHSGRYPWRQAGHDNRLPAPGDGRLDWRGYLPFAENPHVYNPRQGVIVNWNNRPERGWPNSDLWWRRWGEADRVDVLLRELNARERFSSRQLWEINRRASFADVHLRYLLPRLERALEAPVEFLSADSPTPAMLRRARDVLREWDGQWRDEDRDGEFDGAGPALMQTWTRILLRMVLRDDVGEENFARFAATGYPTAPVRASIAVAPGVKMIVANLAWLEDGGGGSRGSDSRGSDSRGSDGGGYDFFNGREPLSVLAAAFAQAVAELTAAHGADMERWRLEAQPLVFSRFNFRGVEQTTEGNEPRLPVVMNRGSENNWFVADGGRIAGRDVFAPGQSGFIDPSGRRSRHYDDQMELYGGFGSKALPFTPGEVEGAREYEEVILVPR